MQGHEGATAEDGPWVFTLDVPSYMPVMQVRGGGPHIMLMSCNDDVM